MSRPNHGRLYSPPSVLTAARDSRISYSRNKNLCRDVSKTQQFTFLFRGTDHAIDHRLEAVKALSHATSASTSAEKHISTQALKFGALC
jgi:hypothetical protein